MIQKGSSHLKTVTFFISAPPVSVENEKRKTGTCTGMFWTI